MTLSVVLKTNSCKYIHIIQSQDKEVSTLEDYLDESCRDCYFVCNGHIAVPEEKLRHGCVYHAVPRLIGGKGGFGSMLRALGAQIEKTTNREACRDLSGRRMRDVNNEKKLKDWVDKKAEREKERERKSQEKREKRLQFLTDTKHNFVDPDYHKQKIQVTEQLEDALQQGLQKAGAANCPSTSGTESRKRKSQEHTESSSSAKRACEWLGIEDMSDVDSSESDSDDSAIHGPSVVPATASTTSTTQGALSPACSDSGVESSSAQQAKTTENSPVDVDSAGSDTGLKLQEHVTNGKTEQMQVEAAHKSARDSEEEVPKKTLLASLPPPTSDDPTGTQDEGPVELELMSYSMKSDLEGLGLDRLKAALMARGLKCGGTLQQRAERLWSVRGKSHDDIEPSQFAKSTKGKTKGKK